MFSVPCGLRPVVACPSVPGGAGDTKANQSANCTTNPNANLALAGAKSTPTLVHGLTSATTDKQTKGRKCLTSSNPTSK
jgi:hypothetical protein